MGLLRAGLYLKYANIHPRLQIRIVLYYMLPNYNMLRPVSFNRLLIPWQKHLPSGLEMPRGDCYLRMLYRCCTYV